LTKDGDYYIRMHRQGAAGTEELAQFISENTSFSPLDVRSFLMALPQYIARILVDGKTITLPDFLGINVSASIKKGVNITDPNYVLRDGDIDLHINIQAKAAFEHLLHAQLQEQKQPYIKLSNKAAKPIITYVYDFKTQTKGSYSPGNTFGVYGSHFSSPKNIADLPSDSGVFFVLADKSEVRATIYSTYKHEEIHCMVPPAVTGTVSVIVRQRNGNDLVEAKVDNITQSP
ncbi:MAG: hypothetical protein AAF975_01985, partial [Spirochaetota bacterium]